MCMYICTHICILLYTYIYIYIYIYIYPKGFAPCRRPLISGCWLADLLAAFIGLVLIVDALTVILEALGHFSGSWIPFWRPWALAGGIGWPWGRPEYPRMC